MVEIDCKEENWSVNSADNSQSQPLPVSSHSSTVNINGTISSGNVSDSEDLSDVFKRLNEVLNSTFCLHTSILSIHLSSRSFFVSVDVDQDVQISSSNEKYD